MMAVSACAPGLAERTRRWPPIGRILTVSGLDTHVWEQGRGQPVILIHGASGNLRDWSFDFAKRLAKDYRVIAFDRPGFGYSDRLPDAGWDPARQAAHLREAAALLGAENPIIVGHSWGGALAMAWALDAPDRTRGVVSLAGATMPWGGDLSPFYGLIASGFSGPILSRLVSATLSEQRAASFVEPVFAPQSVPEGYAEYVGTLLATRSATLVSNALDLVNLDAALTRQSKRYSDLRVPVEVLHGTADVTVAHTIHAEPMHAVLPNSRLSLLEGIGHMPHHADPGAVMAAISRLSGDGPRA